MDENEPEGRGINYLYFGALFVLLLVLTTASILTKSSLAGSRPFFWFYALGQSALEVTLFIFFGWLIHKKLGNKGFAIFVGFTFVCYVIHFLDFVVDRLLDLSFWSAIKGFVFEENYDNFLLLLDASGIPLSLWILIFSLIISVPIFGLIFYKGTNWLAKRKPIPVKKEVFVQLFVCIPAALLFWDFSASKVIHPDAYTEFVKSLPWKRTFLMPETVHMPLLGSLRMPDEEKAVSDAIAQAEPTAAQLPNVFLFVVESLRADFLNRDTAPNLMLLKSQSLTGETTLANANFTSLSWFSIFHSQLPFFWIHRQEQQWKSGSPALQLFKKLGYSIRVYSSAKLEFYSMDKLIFGEGQHLIDSYRTFHHEGKKAAWETDRDALHAMQADIKADPSLGGGQLFIVFWDATHFDYSYPKSGQPPFQPAASDLAFFRTYPTHTNKEKIKNRYRNAIHQMDRLFGEFLTSVNRSSLIAFTGDHGEEFFDHGHLFHGSHLTQEQLRVPILLKLGGGGKTVPLLSQIDIFPTLLDAVCNQTFSCLAGESALRPRVWPFAVSTRFNARRAPYEFCVENGRHKLIAQFGDKGDIFNSKSLRILSLKDAKDRTCYSCEGDIQGWVRAQFGAAFSHLFETRVNYSENDS